MSFSTRYQEPPAPLPSESGLDIVDRVSEMCFGLFMALTFVGAVSTGLSGPDAGHTMLRAALGCNLAWGLADALMHLVNTLAGRGRRLSLVLAVKRAPDAASGIGIVREAMPPLIQSIMADVDLEPLRLNLVNLPRLPDGPRLHLHDVLWAARVFFIVVLSTFPVALPFVLLDDIPRALFVSRALTLAMLFAGGFALGRHAGLNAWLAGLGMTVLGVLLTMAIIALGG
ncbi:hypothetical protein DVT68_17465 [Dyella solisilvae]|uniref:VIT family protein n=1 Tax=Dyella solisilvae TaxID=1920168 RepID=A0A370K571_9GAMM|nr:hypothetical protein [Dyella solisilvae]RDI97160.1 hypothetical protein DVT68_17465 [Dyella solisilvae]